MPLVANSHVCIITGKAPTTIGEKSEDLPSHCHIIVVHAAFGPWRSEMMQSNLYVFLRFTTDIDVGISCRMIHNVKLIIVT